jgi:cysteine-rich repeat protein
MRLAAFMAILAVVADGCSLRPPYLLVSVEDPDGLATGFATLAVGRGPGGLRAIEVDRHSFPLTITVTAGKAGEQDVWVEARDDQDAVLARGRTTAAFRASGTPTATVVLRNACQEDVECAGIGYCTGTKRCISAVCGCVESQCGDGFHDLLLEECDDGNADSIDACTAVCTQATCGDGYVWAGVEVCDDGNRQSGDGCRSDCQKLEVCGDGVVDDGEDCDDGNANPNDGCYAKARTVDAAGCRRVTWTAALVLGLGQSGGRPTATAYSPTAAAVDRLGDIFILDSSGVSRIDHATGMTSTVAKDLRGVGIDIDGHDNLFVADTDNNRVWYIDTGTGIMSGAAGIGVEGSDGDGGPARDAQLSWPRDVAVDGVGGYYIADSGNHRIRHVDGASGVITTFAGTGVVGSSGDNGPAINATLDEPTSVAVDLSGNVYFVDRTSSRVRRVDHRTLLISTVAGNGLSGYAGDGGPATMARLAYPWGLATDADGALYVSELNSARIRKVDVASGIISTVAGNGTGGFFGDGGPATAASLSGAMGVTVAADGSLLIADTGNDRLRRVDALTQLITTVAGNGRATFAGENVPATSSLLNVRVSGITVDGQGSLWAADNIVCNIRRVDGATGLVSTACGSNICGFAGDGGSALDAQVSRPADVAAGPAGDIFIADDGNSRIRCIDGQTGIITTIAGNGMPGFSGDAGPAVDAQLSMPRRIAVDGQGHVLVADAGNSRVRVIDLATGTISTWAGNGSFSTSGDGGLAVDAGLGDIAGLACDRIGNLFIGDGTAPRVRRVDHQTGIIDTVVGDGTVGFFGDGGPAALAQLSRVSALTIDTQNRLLIGDGERIRRVDIATGVISTIAGNGNAGFLGDGGPALDAELWPPDALAADGLGNIFVASRMFGTVRKVDAVTGIITMYAGRFDGEDGEFAKAALGTPMSFTDLPDGNLIIGDGTSSRVRFARFDVGVLQTVAGYPTNAIDEQVPNSSARYSRLFYDAAGVQFVGSQNAVWVTERQGHTIRRIQLVSPSNTATWTVETVAGALQRQTCCNYAADPDGCMAAVDPPTGCDDDTPGLVDGPLAQARFDGPSGMAYDSAVDVIYLADSGNHVIRKLDLANNTVSTVAGIPRYRGFYGEEVDAAQALFDGPQAVAIGPNAARANGSLYIADTDNHRVRRLDLDSMMISTVIGDGVPASSGIGVPARYFPVDSPQGLVVDRFGNLFVTSRNAVREIYAGDDGVATGDDPVNTIYGRTPRENWPEPATFCLTGIGLAPDSVDDSALYFLDACQGFLVKLTRALALP